MCPSTDEWDLDTVAHSSAIWKEKLESFVGNWMHFEIITFSEVNQTHTVKFCMVSLI